MRMSCSYMDKRTQLGHISAPGDEGDLGSPNPGTISGDEFNGDGELRPTTGKLCSIYLTP